MILILFAVASARLVRSHEERSFVAWMREANQVYTGDEYHFRFGIFLTNFRLVREHNARSKFRLGLNRFTCHSPAEYRVILGVRHPISTARPTAPANTPKVASYDWRDYGVVNPIKDQGDCGSDWAFVATQSAESVYAIVTQTPLLSFSESNLVDCVASCYGCNGGLATEAWDYVIAYQNGKFNSEDTYPYKPVTGSCKFDPGVAIGLITGYTHVAPGDEDDLAAKVVGYGPVAGAVDSSPVSFQLYEGGIYDDPTCSSINLNHAIGVVGFGVEDATQYWIVRNSWGEDWGEEGYMRLVRGKNACGIAALGYIATIAQ
jgi:cathepsin L